MKTSQLNGQPYPLANRPSPGDLTNLPPYGGPSYVLGAYATGEFRPPQAGEWYLSGALIEACRTPNDLGTPHHIARLVVCRKQVTTRYYLVENCHEPSTSSPQKD